MNKTTNYQLNQWERTDRVRMEDFNADNAKIDAAIRAEADARTAGDAALSAGKADKTALTALQTAVNGKGNCRVVFGQYTGDGTYGSNHTKTLTFDSPIALLMVHGYGYTMVAPRNAKRGYLITNGTSSAQDLTWGENSVSWYAYTQSDNRLNGSGQVYDYVAFLAL